MLQQKSKNTNNTKISSHNKYIILIAAFSIMSIRLVLLKLHCLQNFVVHYHIETDTLDEC